MPVFPTFSSLQFYHKAPFFAAAGPPLDQKVLRGRYGARGPGRSSQPHGEIEELTLFFG